MDELITTLNQKTKPDLITKDCYGTAIIKGAKISFNRSGSVRAGIIESFKTDWKKVREGLDDKFWWNASVLLEVRNLDGTISKVKNPNSFYIL